MLSGVRRRIHSDCRQRQVGVIRILKRASAIPSDKMLQELLTGKFLWGLGNPTKLELTGRYKFGERPITYKLSRSENLTRFQGKKDDDEGAIGTY